ncbi:DUF222 domain-containing protein [Microbacterium sp. NPDC057659]|uniref:HNH endonuclease signature motif containing protein n=1 Tax=Microbacterium sp. NPDC057659 TaxID=3346198 RepID=UPI00366A95CD
MTSTVNASLEQLHTLLEEVCSSAEVERQFDVASASELIDTLVLAGRVQRRLDAVIVEATAQVLDRDLRERDARVSTRAGCRDAEELLRRTLRVDGQAARKHVSAAGGVHREVELTTGAQLPAKYEQLHAALLDGELSLSGFVACTAPIDAAHPRLSRDEIARADAVLADAARGHDLETGEAGGPPPTTDELAAFAHRIVAHLDPDGEDSDGTQADRRRGITLGRLRDGCVPVRGSLLPEVAGQLQRIWDSILNPKADAAATTGVSFRPAGEPDADEPVDERTPAQKRHDALATALNVAAASGRLPTLGGAAPTLVVSVSASDYAAGAGRATIEGTGWDVPIAVARHTGCAGGIQRVLFDGRGAIVGIGTSARIFNALQRRAIVLRDRECLIPGCHVPATWCEVHHVREHADGGPTHTDNGVALCWHHHRTLDVSGWRIRMRAGVPEIRGPGWWDPSGRWRRPRARAGSDDGLAAALARERVP